jgi:hypothetical protein
MWDRTAEPSPADPARRRNPDLQRPCSAGVWSSSLSNPGRRPADPCNRVHTRVKVRHYHTSDQAIFHGPRCLGRYDRAGVRACGRAGVLQEDAHKVA